MMKAKDMNKVTVFGPKSYMKEIIETLYNLNVVNIEDYTKKTEEDYFEIGEPYAENEKYADILIKLRTMISKLGLRKSGKNPSKISIKEIESKTNELYDRITALLRKEEYFSDIKRAYEKKKVEEAVSSLKLGSESDYSSMAHYVGFINTNEAEFKEKVGKLTAKFELYWTNYDGIPVMALLAGVKKHDKIIRLLNEYEFSPMDNPLVKKQLKLKSKSGIKFVKEDYQLKLVTEKLEHIKKEIEKLKEHNSGFLEEAEKKLSIEAEKAEAPLRIATTKNTFLIKGWVPVENKEKLQSSLEAITKGRVMVEFEKPTTKEKPPIAFNHPKIVEPFEAFMNLYTLPSYKEIDPTFFMFLTFPIFFGFMLGDVGYGLVILTLFLILKKKMPGAKNFLNAFIIAAVASIAFGAVFGEYFGYEEVSPGVAAALGIHPEEIFSHGEIETVYPIPHLFSRSHGINDLLSMAILFGVVHVLIGYMIGFINVAKAHGIKHAIFEKAGWMLLFPAVIYLLTDFLGVVTGFIALMLAPLIPPMPVMIALALLGVLLIIKGEGVQGAIELPALLSNILSYARLMAVGLASLSLALVVNDLAGQMFSSGIIGIIMGTIVLVLGHTINIALGVLSPFLHSLRLHYVEFFTKFFKGGGTKYNSFGYKN